VQERGAYRAKVIKLSYYIHSCFIFELGSTVKIMKQEQERNLSSGKEGSGRDLNLYAMSKEGLIKKVQILMHELAIYRRCE